MDKDTTTRLTSLEEKLDELSKAVATGFAKVSTGIQDGFTKVEGRLTKIEGRLTKIEVFAEHTDTLCRNIWDSQTSLERRMEEGFNGAKKDREENYRLLSRAIQSWGERVAVLETRRAQPTKRKQ